MSTPTPTPRTDAATYPADCLGTTLVTNRDCPRALERELTALTAERDQLRADCENETKWAAHYLAESIAVKAERDQLRAALALGQLNCDNAYDDLRTERDQLRSENATLRAAQKACEACDEPSAFEVRQLRARAERAEASLHALGLVCGTTDANKFETWTDRANARAERAEAELAAERDQLRAEVERRNDIINRASVQFFHDGSDGETAAKMLTVLNEAKP